MILPRMSLHTAELTVLHEGTEWSHSVVDQGEGSPPPPLFWVKKEEMKEGRKASRTSKSNKTGPSP